MLTLKMVRVLCTDPTGAVWEVCVDPLSGNAETGLLSNYKPTGIKPDPMELRARAVSESIGRSIMGMINSRKLAAAPESTGARRGGGLEL